MASHFNDQLGLLIAILTSLRSGKKIPKKSVGFNCAKIHEKSSGYLKTIPFIQKLRRVAIYRNDLSLSVDHEPL